ncbi:binding-protein-dependent transport systems inner membrane component [Clostridium sp. CAG:1013]|nr:binding-protein-dependent transport systems inner membrane component [Clostridium sp. CAG:1013]
MKKHRTHTGFFKQIKRESKPDRFFYFFNILYLSIAGVVVLYPLLYSLACSFSSTDAIIQGRVVLWPVEFTLDSYKAVLQYGMIGTGFLNSILYCVGATITSVVLLLLAAYPLSRRDLPGKKWLTYFFVVTMFFNGGIIPNYILMSQLNLIGSRWSLIIAFMFSCYNMIIVKSYFQTSIPQGLLDAAHIDGCNDFLFFLKMAIPLAKPVIAVMVLFNMVSNWNGYFRALLYLTDPETFSLQQVLRSILFVASMPSEIVSAVGDSNIQSLQNLLEQLRYAVLMVGMIPMMLVYPFVQKFFVKGMMIGSLKE